MNLSNLILWCASIIIAWAGVEHIDEIQRSILKAQARLLYESRASNWGSPKFLLKPDCTAANRRKMIQEEK